MTVITADSALKSRYVTIILRKLIPKVLFRAKLDYAILMKSASNLLFFGMNSGFDRKIKWLSA